LNAQGFTRKKAFRKAKHHIRITAAHLLPRPAGLNLPSIDIFFPCDYSRSVFTRRRFLQASAVAAVLPNLARAAEPKPMLIGSQLYGWGQYYEREKKPFNVDEILSALRDMGYDYAENSTDPDNLAQAANSFAEKLRAKNLKPISMYSGGRFHDEVGSETAKKFAKAAKTFRQAGFTILVCNPDPIGRPKTPAELETQAKNIALAGAALKQAGVRLALHQHTPEFANNAAEYHSNFRKTKPDDVGFCYDVHWVFRGGNIRPPEALRDYGDRVATWHLRQSRDKIWWEDLDTGDIDYAWVGKYAKEHGLPRNYTVELALENGTKITRSCVENHRRSLEYVRKAMA
jgi:inosose dehydratase